MKAKYPGQKRFLKQLDLLEDKIIKTNSGGQAARDLYRNDMRTPLFMLEGLSRMYRKIHTRKQFIKMLADFKMAEDSLGAIDYHDAFARWCTEKNQPALADYFISEREKAFEGFKRVLKKRDWVSLKKGKSVRIRKFRKKLKKADFEEEKKDTKEIQKRLLRTCEKIKEAATILDFNHLEDGVHEFRRNIRWFSIYAQCLDGLVQLQEDNLSGQFEKYLTQSVVNSKYNLMPPNNYHKNTINIRKSPFYALSYIIEQLGALKDEGQLVEALSHALTATRGLGHAEAVQEATQLAGVRTLDQIKQQARKLVDDYIADKAIDYLVEDLGPKKGE